MRLFVTGGAGYVGSHCVRRLLDAGHSVTVFDNLSYGHRAAVDARAAFVQGDLADAGAVRTALTQGYDGVLHFAGFINVGESVREPLMYYQGNVVNTLNLLEAMRDAAVRRMVFSSTCAIYGTPQTLPIHEDLPKQPISPYGASKLVVEWLLADCAAAWGLGAVALRYFNASGASSDTVIGEDHQPEFHLIPLVLQVALRQRENIQVFGTDYPTPDGSCVRDYIHVEDLAEAHLRAIEELSPGAFEAYNVGTGRGHSVLEVVQAAREVTGHAIPVVVAPRRPGDPPELYANAARLQTRFSWRPQHTELSETIRSAWRWHSANPQGYRRAAAR